MKREKIISAIFAVIFLTACSENGIDNPLSDGSQIPITMSSVYPVNNNATRATDNGFVNGDAVGVFVVDYDAEGNAGEPMLQGNRASNVRFAYDGGNWTANYQLYWANKVTPADFYGYYPFEEAMTSVTSYSFAVNRQQDSEATTTSASGYEKSDLLWSKTEKVMPTTETIEMQYRHLMAGITVELVMGTGFTAEEWAELDKNVLVENTVLTGTVNLKTGTTSVGNNDAQPITPLEYNGKWRAVTYPQSVVAGKSIISITVDGHSYNLRKEETITYASGKMHNFTIQVDRSSASGEYTFTLGNESIVAWVDDSDLHDGLVREYTIITLDEAGSLKQAIDSKGLAYELIKNLKVVGPLNSEDLEFMGKNLNAVQNLNFQKVILEDGALGGFDGHSVLQHIIFPEKGLTTIKERAFGATGLIGSLAIPEGVVTIKGEAFMDCKSLKGTLTLPSTLKRIEGAAFAFTGFTGELRLPDGIEYIDPNYYWAFQGCDFEGPLYLPESLTSLPNLGFPKITGKIIIPRNITVVGGFGGIGCSSVEFHDGVTEISGDAFIESQLSGELVLPQNLKKIGGKAFGATKITKIIFPDALRIMEDGNYDIEGTFANCIYLTGTVELPKNVARIPEGCFINCSGITGIVIPKNVDIIAAKAFHGCSSIGSIVCENPEPPVLGKEAFYGVNKDNFTVEVPKGSVEKYKNAAGWSDFKRIAEYSNFVCRPAQANALNTVHSETLVLNADGAWQLRHAPDWITLSATSGTGKTELRMTFKELAKGAGNRRDSILFTMPETGYETYCVVSQYDYEYDEDSYLTLQSHTKGSGINIVFLGDGYDGEDISNGSYLQTVKTQMECFFGVQPYKLLRDYFNVYVAFPLSQEKGVNTMYTYVNNCFGTLYGYDGTMCTSNQLLIEDNEVIEYVKRNTPMKNNLDRGLIILVPNSPSYDGVTYYAEAPISVCPPSDKPYPSDLRGVIQHEAGGHGFGKLGDESITYSAWAPAGVKGDIDGKHNVGWYMNLATTSKLSSVPWADFIFDVRYSDFVDVYEGGAQYMRGIFRPEVNSCMNYGIPYYNAPSRLSIMRRIFEYVGEPFSMDYFYANDSKEWGETEVGTRAVGMGLTGTPYTGSNTHRPPMVVTDKRMSNSVRQLRAALKAKRDN